MIKSGIYTVSDTSINTHTSRTEGNNSWHKIWWRAQGWRCQSLISWARDL